METSQTDKLNSSIAKGQTLETITFQKDESKNIKVLRKLTTKYTYDKKGNWITETTFVNTTPRALIEREIIYY